MAHEMISFDGRSLAFRHLEIELCFRSLITEILKRNDPNLLPIAEAWQEGLKNSSIGVIDVDITPHFTGADDSKRLLHLLMSARSLFPEDGQIPIQVLNDQIGSEIHTSTGYLDAEVVDKAFSKMANFISPHYS